MKNTIYFIIFVLVLIGVGFGGWFLFSAQSGSSGTATLGGTDGGGGFTLPSGSTTGSIGGNTTQTGGSTQGGGTGSATANSMEGKIRIKNIVVQDFREGRIPEQDPLAGPTYYLSAPTEEDPLVPYSIAYFEEDQGFIITLDQNPIGIARAQAEEMMRQELGVDNATLCMLEYQVFTPQSISPEFAGKDLRFSFCPQAIALPEL